MVKLEKSKKLGRKFLNPVPTQLAGIGMIFRILPLYLSKPKDAFPRRDLGPFRTDSSVYATPPASGVRVTWFGHSSMLLEIDGVRLLIDPVWDERASPWKWMGPKRFFAPTMKLADLPPLDAVLISHDHYDHLGKATVRELARLRPELRWITSLCVGKDLRRFGVRADRITELDWTDSTEAAGLKITSLPARHFSGRTLSNRFETLWAAFAIKSAHHNLYFSADSGHWPGFEAIGREYGPFDLAMIEVGAFHELWSSIHLGPDAGVAAFQALGGGVMMPIHWGLFDLALHSWTQPIERVRELAIEQGIKLFSPEPGRPEEFHAGTPVVSDWWRR